MVFNVLVLFFIYIFKCVFLGFVSRCLGVDVDGTRATVTLFHDDEAFVSAQFSANNFHLGERQQKLIQNMQTSRLEIWDIAEHPDWFVSPTLLPLVAGESKRTCFYPVWCGRYHYCVVADDSRLTNEINAFQCDAAVLNIENQFVVDKEGDNCATCLDDFMEVKTLASPDLVVALLDPANLDSAHSNSKWISRSDSQAMRVRILALGADTHKAVAKLTPVTDSVFDKLALQRFTGGCTPLPPGIIFTLTLGESYF